MSYVERHLIAGESVRHSTKLHWIAMLGYALVAAIFIVLAAGFLAGSQSSWKGVLVSPPPTVMYWGAFICFALGAICFCIGLLKRNATEMALTNQRVIVKTGLISRRTIEIVLSRIESIVVEESALGRILGYGTVIVRGTGGTPEVFEKIARPLEFRERVQSQLSGAGRDSL